jgi:serine/threonine protein kinase
MQRRSFLLPHLSVEQDPSLSVQPSISLCTAISISVSISPPSLCSRSPTSLAMSETELPHNVAARYTIGEVLGKGGFAEVRTAISKVDDSTMAIKIMTRQHINSEAEKGIRSEVSLLQSLNHPNIVRGFDFFEEKDHFYFVLEKIDGGELFDRIVKKSHYSEKEARDLVKVLLGGIKYMHDRSIVHRLVYSV